MNVQTVYTFACILLLLLQACQGSECDRPMFQSLYTAFHVSKHWLIRSPVLSNTCRMLNKCADHIYIYMHGVPCVTSISGIRMWRTHVPIIVHCIPCIRTSAEPNTCAFRHMQIVEWMCRPYINLHACCALGLKHDRDWNVLDACFNHCPLHSMYQDTGLAKHQRYLTHGHDSANSRHMAVIFKMSVVPHGQCMSLGVVPPHDRNTCTFILFKGVNWLHSVTRIVPPFCRTQYTKDQRLGIQAQHIWSDDHTNPTREEDHTCSGQGFTTVSSTITHCIPFKKKGLVSWRTRVQQ